MCGIFGIINSKRTQFEKDLFNILGVENDSRGGDSCGIFIDGDVEYGFGNTKYYSEFFKESNLLKNTKDCQIALGHDRKASVGKVSLDKAHPNVIKDKNGNIVFVTIHNGTIHNYKELAKKYIPNIDISNMSDSQVMTHIFYYCGYEVLSEYIGGAVFVIADYRYGANPKILAFKGASKKSQYYAKVEEERPFYYCHHNNSIIFSSIPTFLPVMSTSKDNIYYTIYENTLVELHPKRIRKVKEFDRSKACQATYTYTSNYNYKNHNSQYNNSSNNNKGNNKFVFGDDDYWDDYEVMRYYKENDSSEQYAFSADAQVVKDETDLLFQDTDDDKCPIITKHKNDKIIMYDRDIDCYMLDGEKCHGKYAFGSTGNCNSAYSIGEFYFWEGVILRNKACLKFLEKICVDKKIVPSSLIYRYPNLIHFLSPYPFKQNHKKGDLFYISKDAVSSELFSGVTTKLIDSRQITIMDGVIKDSQTVPYSTAIGKWSKACSIDFSSLYKVYINI